MRRRLACVLILLFAAGCNRAVARIPLAALPFPHTPTGFHAPAALAPGLTILPLDDTRERHYGQPVGGTSWTACRTDTFAGNEGLEVVQQRIDTALRESGLFDKITFLPTQPEPLVLHTQMDAFCAQVIGFVYTRVAGIAAFRFRLLAGERTLFDETIEQVVTDTDAAYSGGPVSTIEQAMRRAMADSLRLILQQLLTRMQSALARAPGPGTPARTGWLTGERRGGQLSLPAPDR